MLDWRTAAVFFPEDPLHSVLGLFLERKVLSVKSHYFVHLCNDFRCAFLITSQYRSCLSGISYDL